MKTIQIKVENDSTIELLKNIKGVTIKEPEKGWWDAFLEYYGFSDTASIEYRNYSAADCIKISKNGDCNTLRPLMQYVLKFPNGGFWKNEHGLFFLTCGLGSHEDATYESAKEFLLGK